MDVTRPSTSSAAPALADPSPSAAAWQALVRYIIRFCRDEFMIVNVSVLVNRNTPLAWKVSGQPIAPFYTELDSGDTAKQWMAFSRHLLAKCSGNNGLALVDTDTIIVHHGRPLMWVEADLRRIHPLEVSVSPGNGEDVACRVLYPHYIREMAEVKI